MSRALFKVLSPGGFTTVQDEGRRGFQHLGVPLSGAVDRYAYRIANLLAGNGGGEPALEMTIIGPRLEVLASATVAVTGAECSIRLNDEELEGWRSFEVKSGDLLEIGQATRGCRSYLAVSGGIPIAPVQLDVADGGDGDGIGILHGLLP